MSKKQRVDNKFSFEDEEENTMQVEKPLPAGKLLGYVVLGKPPEEWVSGQRISNTNSPRKDFILATGSTVVSLRAGKFLDAITDATTIALAKVHGAELQPIMEGKFVTCTCGRRISTIQGG